MKNRLTSQRLRIGYSPCSRSLQGPGDARRFPRYARQRGIPFELVEWGKQYDLVVLSARADVTSWVHADRGTKVVYDLVDSYLDVPRFDIKALLRGTAKFVAGETKRMAISYRAAIEAMCRRADAVVCATDEQKATLLGLCSNVHQILDIHTDVVRSFKTDYRTGDVLNLVWEGLPENLRAFEVVAPALMELAAERSIVLHCVTDLRFAKYLNRFWWVDTVNLISAFGWRTYLYQWNTEMLSHIAAACDLAIIPIDLANPFAAGKPENRLLLLWRMGIPTLAAATPAYERSMAACGLDMACGDLRAWRERLRVYASEEPLRRTAGEIGRAFAEETQSEAAICRRWDELLESL